MTEYIYDPNSLQGVSHLYRTERPTSTAVKSEQSSEGVFSRDASGVAF